MANIFMIVFMVLNYQTIQLINKLIDLLYKIIQHKKILLWYKKTYQDLINLNKVINTHLISIKMENIVIFYWFNKLIIINKMKYFKNNHKDLRITVKMF